MKTPILIVLTHGDALLHSKQRTLNQLKGNNYENPSGDVQLRNAFKLNAWFQLSHLTEKEAKIEYIKLVNKFLK